MQREALAYLIQVEADERGERRIRDKLEVLENNVEDKLLQLGWKMEEDEVADCANKEEEAVIAENVADVTPLQCSCIMSLHKTAMPHVSNLMSMTKLPM